MRSIMFLLLTFIFACPAFATSSIPEIPYGSATYQELQAVVSASDQNSVRYVAISLNGLQGSLSYRVDQTDLKNPLNAILMLGSKIFLIPAKFSSLDNFHRFRVLTDSSDGTPGLYMEMSGFRVDLELDRPVRVVANMRIADENGNALPALQYDETMTQAQAPNFLETHARVTLTAFSMPAPQPLAQAPTKADVGKADFLVDEELPGTPGYLRTTAVLDHAQGWDQIYYLDFDFANVKGRIAIPSAGLIVGNNVLMYIEINGRAFRIPFDFYYFDNWTTFTRETSAAPDGIYLTQRGFRMDSNTNLLTRVISRIRIADITGVILPKLEYHEDVTPAKTGTSDILIERDFY